MNPLRNIRVVLVRPTYGGNLGSVCRAMKNMDLSRLVLVQPNPEMNFGEAQQMSMHAVDILEAREQFDTLADAVKDCQRVYGTTARKGLYRAHSKSPREWAPELIAQAATGPVAIAFGTEDSGLTNEELAMCTNVIRIPSSTRYSSLNLAQAVLICAYEIFLANEHYEPPQEHHAEAPHLMRERMYAMWNELMRDIGFFDDDTSEHMMMAFRRIFARGKLSEADANIMMGVVRQAQWRLAHPEAGDQKPEIRGQLPGKRET
jgi:TrmH family RNA methyltransferase